MNNSNYDGVLNVSNILPYAITYNISPEELNQYNMISIENALPSTLISYTTQNPYIVMNNSSTNLLNNNYYQEGEVPESTLSSRKNTIGSAEEGRLMGTSKAGVVSSNKIGLLRKVLEGIHDDYQILITSKPKNKSNKIRKSNRHSRFRGVSLNGKKWQVMIMGPIKKKYFGGIATEREAAVFYDKLSILTNGLAAKTNFNYRKCDLMKMMAELEYMESQIS
mmetsp:Transcript_434/g.458  ORF Transcript_434/g.458 Transcript_434/m.458 type:complete len:222 (-) Transcript_434:98-763(-)